MDEYICKIATIEEKVILWKILYITNFLEEDIM